METNIKYCQVVEMTDEEKLEMYMKLTKTELSKMLIEANKHLDMVRLVAPCPPIPIYPTYPMDPFYTTGDNIVTNLEWAASNMTIT